MCFLQSLIFKEFELLLISLFYTWELQDSARVKRLAAGRMADKWMGQASNSRLPDSKAFVL